MWLGGFRQKRPGFKPEELFRIEIAGGHFLVGLCKGEPRCKTYPVRRYPGVSLLTLSESPHHSYHEYVDLCTL